MLNPSLTLAKNTICTHAWTKPENALPIWLRDAVPPKWSFAAEYLLKLLMCLVNLLLYTANYCNN